TTLRMHGGIVEENAVIAGFELQADDEFLVGAPVGVIHAGGAVIAAVPGGERLAIAVLLQPIRGRGGELRAKVLGPIAVEGFELHDRSGADVTNAQADAA